MFGTAVQESENVHLSLAGWITCSESAKLDDLWFYEHIVQFSERNQCCIYLLLIEHVLLYF